MTLTDANRERISSIISSDRVVLFMKGMRQAPQCGFSATVVQVLDKYVPSYTTVDVLRDPDIREGIKAFSEWPTIPQLYVGGEFVGGCDIVRELDENGELPAILGESAQAPVDPTITITDAAAAVFQEASKDAGDGEALRLAIDPRFQNDLAIGPQVAGDLRIEANGITLLLDPASARRADGLMIDYAETPQPGFKLENPNAPPQVRHLSVQELKDKLDGGESFELVDVRTDEEREIAAIEGSRLLNDATINELQELPRDTTLVFHCHHGQRSHQAAQFFIQQGFRNVFNVVGGIDAWALDIDPDVPRY